MTSDFRKLVVAIASALALTGPAGAALLVPPGAGDTILAFDSSDDDFAGPVALPFAFTFFGTSYSSAYVGTNGNLTFGFGDAGSFNAPLGDFGPARIAPFFDDLTLASGDVRTSASASQFVVTWNAVALFDGTLSAVNAQAILGSDGSIILSYGDLLGSDGEATIGIADGLGAFASLGAFAGNADGTIGDGALASLAHRAFVFTPDGPTAYAVSEVPEPSTAALLGLGLLAGLAFFRRGNRA